MSDFSDMIEGLSKGTSGLKESLTNMQNRKDAADKKKQEKMMADFRMSMGLMGSGVEVLQKQGADLFQSLAEKYPESFGGKDNVPDLTGMFENYQDTDTFRIWNKKLSDLQKSEKKFPRSVIDAGYNDLLLEVMNEWPQESIPQVTQLNKWQTQNQEARKQNQTDLRSGKIQGIPPNPMGARGMPRNPGIEGRGQYQLAPQQDKASAEILQLQAASAKLPDGSPQKLQLESRIKNLSAPKDASTKEIEGGIIAKWMNGKTLSPQEQTLLDKKIKPTGKTTDQIKEDAKARYKAKFESFKELVGRDPNPEEARAMLITDPWGFLESAGDETDRSSWKKAKNKEGKVLYQNPKTGSWEE